MNNQPIAVLDSGIGGMSIWQEIATTQPHESLLYIADSANVPYGIKSPDEIKRLARNLVARAITFSPKLIVIACNTMTVYALEYLRSEFPKIPMVGTVPVVKTAASLTKNNHIGILSTSRTAASEYQHQLISKFAMGCVVQNIGTDALVPLIEKGIVTGDMVDTLLGEVLQPFIDGQTDTLALGCTHFPFMREAIQAILGDRVRILDSGAAISRQIERVLTNNSIMSTNSHPTYAIYTTGDSQMMQSSLRILFGKQEEVTHITL